ncbi:RNA polymerase sigma factor [Maribacter algicola]|uniref:RNA polymerase sigma factor n=1 Tax=Meishania litoralis TaxID=3434685 RepID=A0ACC7LLU8_9FLAO
MNTADLLESLSDEELVERVVKDNNPYFFGELYDRYARIVYNKCFGFSKSEDEAKDLTQDIFLLLFVKLRTFKGKSKFSTWLYSFTYNFCANHVNRNRERKIQDKAKTIDESEDAYLIHVPEETMLRLKVSKLKKVLEIIPADDKSLLLLKYQDEVPVRELAALFDVSESAVKMRLKRAKSKVIVAYNKIG